MKQYALMDRLVEAGNGYLQVSAVRKHAISNYTLMKYLKTRGMARTAHGVYATADAWPDDYFLLALRNSRIVFSHESALYLNGLAERCPVAHSVTIPSSATLPRFGGAPLKAYYIKDDLFGVGLERRRTTTGALVPCYNAERTICDILRSRSRVDEETIVAALRLIAALPSKDLNRLADYARLFRVERLVHERLEVLL